MRVRSAARRIGAAGWACCLVVGAIAATPLRAADQSVQMNIAPGDQACTPRVNPLNRASFDVTVVQFSPANQPLILNVFGRRRGNGSLDERPIATQRVPAPDFVSDALARIALDRYGSYDAYFPGSFELCALNPRANTPVIVLVSISSE